VNNSFGIETDFGLDDQGTETRFLTGARNFSLRQRVKTDSGVNPASPIGTEAQSPGIKGAGVRSWPLTI
jgi:hypothetical protein